LADNLEQALLDPTGASEILGDDDFDHVAGAC
jgi:hypothetical protein